MAMQDQQIEEYALEAACGHFLCNTDIAVADQLETLRGSEYKIPDGVVPWEEYENTSAPALVERIECLRDGFVRAMKSARDYGNNLDHKGVRSSLCSQSAQKKDLQMAAPLVVGN